MPLDRLRAMPATRPATRVFNFTLNVSGQGCDAAEKIPRRMCAGQESAVGQRRFRSVGHRERGLLESMPACQTKEKNQSPAKTCGSAIGGALARDGCRATLFSARPRSGGGLA
ncbi:hypothetical protein C7S13_6518 [Burkholderia cepacia]|nr:hypothetical protein [Burkholderia cepacia]